MADLTLSVDEDGIATLTWDQAGRSMNVIDPASTLACAELVERVLSDPGIKGAVITSAKPAFIAGADLAWIESLTVADPAMSPDERLAFLLAEGARLQALTRRIETGGKPFAAAINGTALGGGFELCLACHHRVAADRPGTQLGLPEVKVGLLPAAGGTMRLVRMMGAIAALPLLLDGRSLDPAEAFAAGLVDAVAAPQDVVAAAKSWILSAGPADIVKPWDRPGFVPPGPDPRNGSGGPVWSAINAQLRQRGYGNYPALEAIQYAVYDGWLVPIDTALKIELRAFVKLLLGSNARNMIRTQFINQQKANKLPSRPAEIARTKVRRLGIVGASPLADELAALAAAARIEAVAVELRPGDAAPNATSLGASLAGCDIVFEMGSAPALRAETIRRIEDAIRPETVLAIHTASIASLSETCRHPARLLGLNLCRPLGAMSIAELVAGPQTGREPLARALDALRALGRTPIMVAEGARFYTDRILAAYMAEAHAMVSEGVAPALVENAGRALGMAMPPLALSDEVGLEEIAAGPGHDVAAELRSHHGRSGRRHGKGFYDYPQNGPVRLWPGLADLVQRRSDQPPLDEVKLRLIAIQALEAARCLAEGVVGSPADADLAAVFGTGFAPWTGGPISYIDTRGVRAFGESCSRLADQFGARFGRPVVLHEFGGHSDAFYDASPRIV